MNVGGPFEVVSALPPCARRPTTDDGDMAPHHLDGYGCGNGIGFSRIERSSSDCSLGSGSFATESTASSSTGSSFSLIVDKVPPPSPPTKIQKLKKQRSKLKLVPRRPTLLRAQSLQIQGTSTSLTKTRQHESTLSLQSLSSSLPPTSPRSRGPPKKATSFHASTMTGITAAKGDIVTSPPSSPPPRRLRRDGRPERATSLQESRMDGGGQLERAMSLQESRMPAANGEVVSSPPSSPPPRRQRRGGRPERATSLQESRMPMIKGRWRSSSITTSDTNNMASAPATRDSIAISSNTCIPGSPQGQRQRRGGQPRKATSLTSMMTGTSRRRSSLGSDGTGSASASGRAAPGERRGSLPLERSLSGKVAYWAKRSASKLADTKNKINNEWNDIDEGFGSLLCD